MHVKLKKLSEVEGLSIEEMLEEGTFDSVCWGICTNEGCEYTTQVEPDQDQGYCENCKTQTVASACILAGII